MIESRRTLRRMAGFTLIEAVVAIVITGILAVIVARFITAPVAGYVDSVRRAELTDAADASLRRIARDVRMALPNSLRGPSPANTNCIEFIPVTGVGRYRIAKDSSGNGNPFNAATVNAAGTGAFSFDALVANGITSATTGSVVVNNLGTVGLDAYQTPSSNKRSILVVHKPATPTPANLAALTIDLDVGNAFTTTLSAGNHFQVIPDSSVIYSCPGDGNLYRWTRLISTAASALGSCPSLVTATAAGYAGTALISNVTSCSLQRYDFVVEAVTHSLLEMTLVIADPTAPGETIQLFNQVHVNNAP